MSKKYDVFVSYRRDGGESTARVIRDRLTAQGYRVFFDVESLRSGAFNTKLFSVIEQCRDVIVVLSPNALDRCVNEDDWVRQEVEHALKLQKNVVPILLRGFDFPAELPPTLDALRYQNGVAATAEYFDAFIEKLMQFLKSKPVNRNLLLRWGLIAVAGVLALGVAGYGICDLAIYPWKSAEKKLTDEVIYYVGKNLTQFDVLIKGQEGAFLAMEQYLDTNSSDRETAVYMLNTARKTVENTDVTRVALTQDLKNRVAKSPFDPVEMEAMHDALLGFQEESVEILEHMSMLTSPECGMTDMEKRAILDAYRAYLEENKKVFAYGTNQILLPVNSKSAMQMLWAKILPEVDNIPLSALDWKTDYDELENAMLKAMDKMEQSIQVHQLVVDSMTDKLERQKQQTMEQLLANGCSEERARQVIKDMVFDYEAEAQRLTEQYMAEGRTQEKAQSLAEKKITLLKLQAQVRRDYGALAGDDGQTLWEKMLLLLSCELYQEARECVDFYAKAVPDSGGYLPGVRAYIDQLASGGVSHGLVVVGYGADDPDTLLQVGDIILTVNGQDCTYLDSYVQFKNEAPGEAYTVTVLRLNQSQTLEEQDLKLTKDMTPVAFYALMMD